MNQIDQKLIKNIVLNLTWLVSEKIEAAFEFIAERYRNHFTKPNENSQKNTYGLSLQQIADLTNISKLEELYNEESKGKKLYTAFSADRKQSMSLIFNYLPRRGWLDPEYDRIIMGNQNSGFILTVTQGQRPFTLNEERNFFGEGGDSLSISFREHAKGKFNQSGFLSINDNFKTGIDYLEFIAERKSWLKLVIDGTATPEQQCSQIAHISLDKR